jgi:hypothetical protein
MRLGKGRRESLVQRRILNRGRTDVTERILRLRESSGRQADHTDSIDRIGLCDPWINYWNRS